RETPLQIENAELARLERRILSQHLNDLEWVRSFLQFTKHEHLILLRVVRSSLTCGDALAGHDHSGCAHQEIVVSVHTSGRRAHNAAGAAIDSKYGPRSESGNLKRKVKSREQEKSTHLISPRCSKTPLKLTGILACAGQISERLHHCISEFVCSE